MLFDGIKTEQDIDALKKRIIKDPPLFGEILRIRKKLAFRRSQFSYKQTMITNAELLAMYKELVSAKKERACLALELLLRKTKTKSNSGVAVISVLTKPYKCPGNCLYCPTEREMPKSYLSREPAAARALLNGFDPARQVAARLKALEANGHPIDKVEMIIIGGTWGAYPKKYRENFVRDLFAACNNYGGRAGRKLSLASEQKRNESARCRIVGLSIETRPDWVNELEISHMRRLGVTKVELGVQHLDDEVLAKNYRHITQQQTAEATRLLRDSGFKIVYHMMLNLPFSEPRQDVAMFRRLFADKIHRPDMLKIYPCSVVKSSALYALWRKGGFRPYSEKILTHTLVKIKKLVPPYVRIMRVIRDIPAEYIVAGSRITNMRQKLTDHQAANNWRCRCIRCREIREARLPRSRLALKKLEYDTLGGKEVFLSWEDKRANKLASFLRLRLPDWTRAGRGALNGAAIVRELHTYGRLTGIGMRGQQSQHLGLGRKLLIYAEGMARKAGYREMAVISGVGVRGYYRKLGYRLRDTYMVKSLV